MALLTYGFTKFTTMRLPSSGKRWYPPVTLPSHGLLKSVVAVLSL